jgi:hypothetical protein
VSSHASFFSVNLSVSRKALERSGVSTDALSVFHGFATMGPKPRHSSHSTGSRRLYADDLSLRFEADVSEPAAGAGTARMVANATLDATPAESLFAYAGSDHQETRDDDRGRRRNRRARKEDDHALIFFAT